MGTLFGTDGVRGKPGEGDLAPHRVRALARSAGRLLRTSPGLFSAAVPPAFARLVDGRPDGGPLRDRVLLGRDTRASGPLVEEWLLEGFREAGVGVVRAGVIPTPGVATLTRLWGCALGVVISASHNPADDNGIKLISPQGFKIPDAAEEAVEAGLDSAGAAPGAPAPEDRAARTGDYVDFLARFGRRLDGLTLVADCAHGASSAYAGRLLERLGARAVVLHATPDGRNINDGCGALHPERLAEAVRREKAHAGVAFDGDADRAIFVDETGEIRDGDHVLAMAGLHLKEKRALPGDTVVSTVMANLGLERALAKRGVSLARTKVGDKFVAEEMLRSGAVLGGEQSGHVLFFDAAPAGDGMLTMLRVLGLLAERGEAFSKAASVLVKYPQTLLNVKVARKPPLDQAPGVQSAIQAAQAELGEEGRLVVRYSGTENLCRVMVEGARREDVDRTSRSVADAVQEALA